MKTYIKVTVPGCAEGYIDTPENAKKILDEMVRNFEYAGDDTEGYQFVPIEMEEEEFENLPDFQGF